VASHGGFVVRETTRPTWRPVDGFERKALEAGRTVTDLRLDRRGAALTGTRDVRGGGEGSGRRESNSRSQFGRLGLYH
jgi:hypothetical protein